MYKIPIVIPSYEPDDRLLTLLSSLRDYGFEDIVLVDDGSGMEYRHYFDEAQKKYDCKILRHHVNMGKGRALKDAFNYLLNSEKDMLGCVTADSDGQHTAQDIRKCMDIMILNKQSLVLGCRDFSSEDVPEKSRFGNNLTKNIMKILYGVDVSDTQTGLRGIPRDFMKKLVNVDGERFEFETNMLIATKKNCNIIEVPIETIYDSKENHQTHFNPIKDSIRIYKIFGKKITPILCSVALALVSVKILFKTNDK